MTTIFKLSLVAAAILCFNITPGIINSSHAAEKPYKPIGKPYKPIGKPFKPIGK